VPVTLLRDSAVGQAIHPTYIAVMAMQSADNILERVLNFPLSLGSLIGTCREVLTILGLPSG
jgi:hypothetical protein